MDRSKITDVVEDYWRSFITAKQLHGSNAALEVSREFEARIAAASRALDPLDGLAFQQAVEADREMLMAEYTSNPLALKRRLGLAFVTGSQKRRSGGQDLGELAVRTAVRATVWEAFEQFFVFFASGSADDRKSLGNLDAVSDACYHPW